MTISITTPRITTISIATPSIITLSIMVLIITTSSIIILWITALSETLRKCDSQHNDTRVIMLSVEILIAIVLSVIMLIVFMPFVNMFSVVAPNFDLTKNMNVFELPVRPGPDVIKLLGV